jgi:HK97 family phage major capsid protein
MFEELKKLLEAQGKAFEAFKEANDARLKAIEAKGFAPADLEEKVNKINAELSELSKEIGEVAKKANRPAAPGTMTAEQAEHARAFEAWFRGGTENGLRELERQANLSTLSDPDGGFVVPEQTEGVIDRITGTVSAMRSLCSVMTIGTDTYKKLVNQGGATSGWVGEKGSRPETTTPTLREIVINTKELYAMPAATQTLLDDARIDIAAWLGDEVSMEFAEQEGDAFINGNGVEQPKGIAAYTMIANASYAWGKVGYIASGHASQLNNLDKLLDLQHALKPAYRNGATWLMNDSTALVLRKFKDGEGNYMWRPGLLEGAPDTFLGKPVAYDDNVDSITNNTYPIFFANFKRAYLIVDRFGIRVLRDPYTSKPYILFYTTKRVGGGITLYEAIKALKISA